MKRNWILKAVLAIAGLALLLFGVNEMQSDPALRRLLAVSITELEQGKSIPHDQFVEVSDAYLIPMYMVEFSHSRKRGDHARVFVPLGTLDMQRKAFEKSRIKPALWIRIDRDFKTKEAADAAMQGREQYLKPYPVSGVISKLEGSVRDEMSKANLEIDQPLALHAGSTPFSYGAGAGVAVAGGLLMLLLTLWSLSDIQAAKWLKALQRPDAKAFQGRTAGALVALIAGPLFVIFGALAVAERIDDGVLATGKIGFALVNLALLVWGLWHTRGAVLLGADTLEFVRNSKRSSVPLSEVTALVVNERKVKGAKVCKYTLHGPAKPVQVGSGLFHGWLDDAAAFGVSLREQLLHRLAPALMEQIKLGERVSFGPLSLSEQGISKGKSVGGDVLPWNEVKATTLKNGQLKIKQKDKMFGWGKFAANKIHNIDVLMHIFQIRGV